MFYKKYAFYNRNLLSPVGYQLDQMKTRTNLGSVKCKWEKNEKAKKKTTKTKKMENISFQPRSQGPLLLI